MKNWQTKNLREYTLEDALEAMEDGFFTMVNDGNKICLTNKDQD